MHFQFMCAAIYRFRRAAGNYSALVTGAMPERNALAVACVEGFLFVAIRREPDPAISQNAVAIHQKKLDAFGARR
jgi:hypothetical protein